MDKDIKSTVRSSSDNYGTTRTVDAKKWLGKVNATFSDEFDTQTDADGFVTKITTSLHSMTSPVNKGSVEKDHSIINTFNMDTTSPSVEWGGHNQGGSFNDH